MLKNQSLKANAKQQSRFEEAIDNLEHMSETELGALRHEIDNRLELDLGSLNLQDELGLQYRQGKALLNAIQNDSNVPANQKAQVYNTVRAQLAEIVDLQDKVWNMERLKKMEVAFIKSVGLLTLEAKKAFFDLYGEHLQAPND